MRWIVLLMRHSRKWVSVSAAVFLITSSFAPYAYPGEQRCGNLVMQSAITAGGRGRSPLKHVSCTFVIGQPTQTVNTNVHNEDEESPARTGLLPRMLTDFPPRRGGTLFLFR